MSDIDPNSCKGNPLPLMPAQLCARASEFVSILDNYAVGFIPENDPDRGVCLHKSDYENRFDNGRCFFLRSLISREDLVEVIRKMTEIAGPDWWKKLKRPASTDNLDERNSKHIKL
jgi:hypothetical protein